MILFLCSEIVSDLYIVIGKAGQFRFAFINRYNRYIRKAL
ncbi:hypothetical protein PROVRETT_09451 [Providencia rettgeri DSM 1131]|nr:hypothetical protein PROVRETT_09451 [Providencia rettgeri DSM 1131]